MEAMLGTTDLRAEFREGLETMFLSRFKRSTAAAISILALVVSAVFIPAAYAQPAADRTISADGVGNATLGLTPAELAAALGDDYEIGNEVRITVDFDGRVVTQNGQVQFRAAMTGQSEALDLFIVSNDDYATAEGVGPTTTIAQAEAIYGQATLSLSEDEGREFVRFANGPQGRIQFRTPGIGGNNVGIYADGQTETTDFEEDATIAAVWVSCVVGSDCPADRDTPAPTPTPEPTPDGGDAGATDNGDGESELPKTGATELVLISIVSALVLVGGALVLTERRFFCPAWLDG